MQVSHETIVTALESLRVQHVGSEYELHDAIAACLAEKGIWWKKEHVLGPRCRIDFLCGDVGIEVKKGKVVSSRMQAQAARYLAFDDLASIVLVIERSVFDMPREINGKPVTVISLNKQWGIAL